MKILSILLLLAPAIAWQIDWVYNTCNTAAARNRVWRKYANEDYEITLRGQCSDSDVALTMWDCFHTMHQIIAANTTDSAERVAEVSYRNYIYTCSQYGGHAPYTLKEIKEVAKVTEYKTFAAANETKSGPFQVPLKNLQTGNRDLVVSRHNNQWVTEQYGQATLFYAFGVMGLGIIFNFLSWVLPKVAGVIGNNKPARLVRQYITMPPLFNNIKVCRAFQYYGERLPMVFLFGYLALSVVALSVRYQINIDLVKRTRSDWISGQLGVRSGFLALYKGPLVFLFAGRNNILIWLTGWDMNVFNHWHRWVARLFTIDVCIHFIAFSINNAEAYSEAWLEPYWKCGAIAFFSMFVMCIQGWKYLRKYVYDFFLVLHILLAIVAVVTTYYHLKFLLIGKEFMYPIFAIWGFDRAARLVRLAMGGIATGTVREVSEGCLEITMKHHNPITMGPGSYVFVSFMDPLYFYQSHPFTVVDTPSGPKLLFKARKGMTRRILKQLQKNNGEPKTYKMLIEGPYGVPVNFNSFKELCFIAGGIGITAVYSHIAPRMRNPDSKQKAQIHWAIPNREPLTWFAEELRLLSAANIEVNVYITGSANDDIDGTENTPAKALPAVPSMGSSGSVGSSADKEKDGEMMSSTSSRTDGAKIHYLRPSIEGLVQSTIEEAQGSLAFFVCGPETINHASRLAVSQNLSRSGHYVQYYDESFCM